MEFNFKVNIDQEQHRKHLESEMNARVKHVIGQEINGFFSRTKTYDHVKNTFTETVGPGVKEITDMTENAFLDDKFQKAMTDYFEANWKRIFEEAMEKALQHKANGVAFNKVHALKE
jgi:hypothetical protein